MPDPTALDTQAERIARAKAEQEARERGIRGQAKREGRDEREREILAQIGARTIEDISALHVACETIREEHAASIAAHERNHERVLKHAVHAAAGRWFGIASFIWIGICGIAVWGASWLSTQGQANAVATIQNVTRPSSQAMRDSMRAPDEAGGFR